MPDPQKTFMLSAGGTGGHLFPAEALATALLKRGHKVVIVTDKRGHAFKSLGDNVPVHCVRAATLKPGILSKITAVFNMGMGILQGLCLVLKYRPHVTVGFGGYPSFPAVFAAQILGRKTLLHEQNAVLGKANAVLLRLATAVGASAEKTISLEKNPKVTITGNPVRAPIIALRDQPYPAHNGETVILITGGSQGANILSDVIPAATNLLPPEIRAKIRLMHQARAETLDAVEKTYAQNGTKADVAPFFPDMAKRLAATHVFIGRSGASTVTEMAVVGRPAIFIPLPGHADQQQLHNTKTLVEAGGAWVVQQADFTPEYLAQKIREFVENPAILADAAQKAHGCGRPDATAYLADLAEKTAG